MSTEKVYKISEAINETGVQRYTLLWWEEKELLRPERRKNPYSQMLDRYYSESDIVRIRVLKALTTPKGKDFCISLLVKTIKGNKAHLDELEKYS